MKGHGRAKDRRPLESAVLLHRLPVRVKIEPARHLLQSRTASFLYRAQKRPHMERKLFIVQTHRMGKWQAATARALPRNTGSRGRARADYVIIRGKMI